MGLVDGSRRILRVPPLRVYGSFRSLGSGLFGPRGLIGMVYVVDQQTIYKMWASWMISEMIFKVSTGAMDPQSVTNLDTGT